MKADLSFITVPSPAYTVMLMLSVAVFVFRSRKVLVMAKSIDRCVVGDCSNVCMKGSDECSACSYVPESSPSMDECYGSGRSCEMDGCFNTPQEDETICSSCWDKLESRSIPGFPDEFDDIVEPSKNCRRSFISELPCDKDGVFVDDCCKTHWVELDNLQRPYRERFYNDHKDAWSVD